MTSRVVSRLVGHTCLVATRDRDNQPLLDANDVMWWIALGMPTLAPVLAWSSGLPWWAALLLAVAIGVAMRPLHKRYRRRVEAQRPRNQG